MITDSRRVHQAGPSPKPGGGNIGDPRAITLRGARRRAWLLLLPSAGYWIFAFANFHFGFLVNPSLSASTYVYLFGCFLAVMLGFSFGVNGGQAARTARAPRPKVIAFGKVCMVLWVIGMTGLVLDRLRGGNALDLVLEDTESVRDEVRTSLITTCFSPLAGLTYIALASYFYAIRWKIRLARPWHFLMFGGVAGVLCNTFLSANRGGFVHVILWIAFGIIYVKGARLGELLSFRRHLPPKLAVLAFVVVALGYIFFIGRNRVSEGFLRANTVANVPRYDVARFFPDDRSYDAFLMLSGYTTQQFVYIDVILAEAAPFDFIPYAPIMFYIRQVDRFIPHLYAHAYFAYANRVEGLGLARSGWPSMFGEGAVDFGYIGFPILLFLMAHIFGTCAVRFMARGTLLAGAGAFIFYNYANYSYMSIPGDGSFGIGGLVLLVIFFVERGGD